MAGEGYTPLSDAGVAAIAKDYFDERSARSSANAIPRIALVGGQPGAGKSAASGLVRDEFKSAGGFVHVDADRMRERLPLGAAQPTSEQTQADAGRLVTALRLMAIDGRRNIVEEGTFRNPEGVQHFVEQLHARGYKVEMLVVATSREESLLGIYQRFERQHEQKSANPRFVSESYHDAAMRGFDASLGQVGPYLDRLRVINRAGELLYDSARQPLSEALPAIQAARHATATRLEAIGEAWTAVEAAARARGADRPYLEAVAGHAARIGRALETQAQATTPVRSDRSPDPQGAARPPSPYAQAKQQERARSAAGQVLGPQRTPGPQSTAGASTPRIGPKRGR